MKRGQAALEFLTTYGWAFIVILVMIGALAYFGVLNPGKMTPNRCLVEPGFKCNDFIINSTGFYVQLENKMGGALTGVTLSNISSDVGGSIDIGDCTSPAPNNEDVGADSKFTVSCNTDLSSVVGDKLKIEFEVSYKEARGTYSKKFDGSVYGTVQG